MLLYHILPPTHLAELDAGSLTELVDAVNKLDLDPESELSSQVAYVVSMRMKEMQGGGRRGVGEGGGRAGPGGGSGTAVGTEGGAPVAPAAGGLRRGAALKGALAGSSRGRVGQRPGGQGRGGAAGRLRSRPAATLDPTRCT